MTHTTDHGNITKFTYFIFSGISDSQEVRASIFVFVFVMYLVTLGGNAIIVFLIFYDPGLHTPMYFWLCNLSCLDIIYTTITLHRIMFTFISGDNSILVSECLLQMYFFMSLVGIELLILTAMSYDRHVAICNPLRYQMVVSRKVCMVLSVVCWTLGFLDTIPFTCIVYKFVCYSSNIINHFFCDLLALMKLTCSDTSVLEKAIRIEAILTGLTPFSLTLLSYVSIIRAIMKIRSSAGRRKAFYTCSSHVTVVLLFYVTLSCLYLRPASMFSLKSDKVLSLVYTALVPMVNPLIYSLKNKDVKCAFKSVLKRYSVVIQKE